MAPGDIGLLQYIAGLEDREKELERELAEIKIAKAHAKRTMEARGIRASLPTGGTDDTEGTPNNDGGPFAGMGVEEAALKHLRAVGRPQKTAEIRDALLAGGLTTKAKNFNSTVFGSLRRLVEKGEADKVGTGKWKAAGPQGVLAHLR